MGKIKTAFVLGAGLGTRLRPLTLDCPKPLLPIKGRPLIERIFDKLIDAGISRIIVNTHHAAQKYADYFKASNYRNTPLAFVHEPTLLDTGGGIKNILPLLDKNEGLLIYNGDILFNGDISKFLDFFEGQKAPAALILRQDGQTKNVGVKNNFVCDMRNTLKMPYDELMQFSGIFAADKTFLNEFKLHSRPIFSSVDIMLNEIQKNPNSIAAYIDNSPWSDIGALEEYLKLK